eukprot:gene13321-2090_t
MGTGGRSMCRDVAGWEARMPVPLRSPILVADAVALRMGRGRGFCEVGTRDGDHLLCLLRAAGVASARGFELDPVQCAAARARGLDVLCGNFLNLPDAALASCDDYYWWLAGTRSPCFFAHVVIASLRARRDAVRVYMASDPQDATAANGSMDEWGGTLVANISFDESEEAVALFRKRFPGILDPRRMFLSRMRGSFLIHEYHVRADARPARMVARDAKPARMVARDSKGPHRR